MHRTLRARALVALAAVAASCGRGASPESAPAPGQPLAAFTGLPLVLTPLSHVRSDTIGLVRQLGGPDAAARRLDSSLVVTLDARGVGGHWVLPRDLQRSYERNRTYAADPYRLAVAPLRSSAFVAGTRYGEPLATQLRTMIALHGDARFVLLPIELRLTPEGGAARGVLRAALVDPRFAQAVWVGEVQGDVAASAAAAVTGVASRLVDLFVAP